MILETLVGVSLLVSASLERPGRERPGFDTAAPMSVQQKNAVVRPVVRSAIVSSSSGAKSGKSR